MASLGTSKTDLRKRRHARVRSKIEGTAARPRLAIYRSNRFVSAQLIDDAAGKTLAQAHGREFPGAQSAQAAAVGKAIAERGKKAGVSVVVFDRGGYSYAAQVRALADAARGAGLTF
ncbi:MAG: large subunit ribosomal protein [Candidatus Parcubacteria bacterium]|jgi:large subunit ribosomal protein L18|nr:large subunit ribosomal protein [Candidatus Parcubacteria bacterium]